MESKVNSLTTAVNSRTKVVRCLLGFMKKENLRNLPKLIMISFRWTMEHGGLLTSQSVLSSKETKQEMSHYLCSKNILTVLHLCFFFFTSRLAPLTPLFLKKINLITHWLYIDQWWIVYEHNKYTFVLSLLSLLLPQKLYNKMVLFFLRVVVCLLFRSTPKSHVHDHASPSPQQLHTTRQTRRNVHTLSGTIHLPSSSTSKVGRTRQSRLHS